MSRLTGNELMCLMSVATKGTISKDIETDSSQFQDVPKSLQHLELIEWVDCPTPGRFKLTARGIVQVDALKNLPLPTKSWIH